MSVLDWERRTKMLGTKIGSLPTYISEKIESKETTLDSYLNGKNKEQTIFEDLTKSDLKNIIEEWQEKNF